MKGSKKTRGQKLPEKLSESEEIVMRCLWDSREPMRLSDVITACEGYGHYWKAQTVSTFLLRLIQKNYIDFKPASPGRRVYFPKISMESYLDMQMHAMLDFWGKPTIHALASAFSQTDALTKEDLTELREMLNDMDE